MKQTTKKMIYKIFSLSIFTFVLSFSSIFAMTMVSLDTDISLVKKGESFSVILNLSTDKSINVVDGTLTYDKNKLQVENIDISKSVLNMWVKEPVFDNKKGEISFTGGIPGGFVGENNLILSIQFKAKNTGETQIDFKDIFKILLNDGSGTQISAWLSPIDIEIIKSQQSNLFSETVDILINKFLSGSKDSTVYGIIFIIFLVLIYFGIKKRQKNV